MNATGKEGRCLGLVGGLGPGATIYYYRGLLARMRRQAEQRAWLSQTLSLGRSAHWLKVKAPKSRLCWVKQKKG